MTSSSEAIAAGGTHLEPWSVKATDIRLATPALSVRREVCARPGRPDLVETYMLDLPDWTNVVALTVEGGLIVVRQYRHGIGSVTTELPAGSVKPGEDPIHAARRELIEETGYEPTAVEGLSEGFCNPALQSNRYFSFLATSCHRTSTTAGDPRSIEVDIVPSEIWRSQAFLRTLGNPYSALAVSLAQREI